MTKALTKAIATLKCVDGNTYVSEVTTFNSAFTIHLPNRGELEDLCSSCDDVVYDDYPFGRITIESGVISVLHSSFNHAEAFWKDVFDFNNVIPVCLCSLDSGESTEIPLVWKEE